MDCLMGNESEVWKGMEGGVWCGVDEESKGRVCTLNGCKFDAGSRQLLSEMGNLVWMWFYAF